MAAGGPRVLNVVQDGDDWKITGLSGGEDLPLYLRGSYPESETPEIVSIKKKERMHRALYDEWQVSDELAAEAKLGDGLIFKTPFGDFETVGVHVVDAENAPKAKEAHAEYQKLSKEIDRIEKEVMEREGFGKAKMNEIYTQHGSKFADWPDSLEKKYWDAYHKAMRASEPVRAKLRAL